MRLDFIGVVSATLVLVACSSNSPSGASEQTPPPPNASRTALCQDALQRRQAALQALATPRKVTLSGTSYELTYNPNGSAGDREPWLEAEKQRDSAEADVKRYCDGAAQPVQTSAPAAAVVTSSTVPMSPPTASPTQPPTPSPSPPAPTPSPATSTGPRTTADPFEFCALAGTADWPVEQYQGAVRYSGVAQPFAGRVWRCWSGKVLGCDAGTSAQVCLKRDTSQTPPASLVQTCRQKGTGELLGFETLRSSVYHWACRAGAPVITGPAEYLDPTTGQIWSVLDILDGLGYLIGPWVEILRR